MNKKIKITKNFFLQATSYKLQTRTGFSLIEALVYIAIVVMLTVVVVNAVLFMVTASGKARLKRNILGEAGIAVERIVREIRLAESVAIDESTFNVHPGVLKLNTIVSSDDDTPITREFFISSSTLMMKEGTDSPVSLTESVTISNLVFYRVVASTTSEAITFELTAQDEIKSLQESQTFNMTAVLRGSY